MYVYSTHGAWHIWNTANRSSVWSFVYGHQTLWLRLWWVTLNRPNTVQAAAGFAWGWNTYLNVVSLFPFMFWRYLTVRAVWCARAFRAGLHVLDGPHVVARAVCRGQRDAPKHLRSRPPRWRHSGHQNRPSEGLWRHPTTVFILIVAIITALLYRLFMEFRGSSIML